MTISSVTLGKVQVRTNGIMDHGPDFYVDKMMGRILHIGDEVGGPVKDQVYMFRDKLRATLMDSVTEIQKAERERMEAIIRKETT